MKTHIPAPNYKGYEYELAPEQVQAVKQLSPEQVQYVKGYADALENVVTS